MDWLASTLSSPPASAQALVSPLSAGRDVSEVEQLGALKVLQVLAPPPPNSKQETATEPQVWRPAEL